MKIQVLTAAALITASLAGFSGQAQAMNLMMALSSANIQIIASEDRKVIIVEDVASEQTELASVELNKTEPAAGK